MWMASPPLLAEVTSRRRELVPCTQARLFRPPKHAPSGILSAETQYRRSPETNGRIGGDFTNWLSLRFAPHRNPLSIALTTNTLATRSAFCFAACLVFATASFRLPRMKVPILAFHEDRSDVDLAAVGGFTDFFQSRRTSGQGTENTSLQNKSLGMGCRKAKSFRISKLRKMGPRFEIWNPGSPHFKSGTSVCQKHRIKLHIAGPRFEIWAPDFPHFKSGTHFLPDPAFCNRFSSAFQKLKSGSNRPPHFKSGWFATRITKARKTYKQQLRFLTSEPEVAALQSASIGRTRGA